MRTFASLCLSCALVACTFEPSPLTGGSGPSPAGDAAVPDAAVDARPGATPDAAPGTTIDAGPPVVFCDPDDPELVACFRFEGTPDDESGTALIVNAIGVDFDEGVSGRAAVLTNSSEMYIESTSALDVAAVTIEMWVRPDALPPTAPARAGLFDNDGQYSMFVFGDGRVQCLGGNGIAEGLGVLTVGTWTHVACVHDGNDIYLYADGQLRQMDTASPLVTGLGNNSHIGSNSPDSNGRFIGRIDELRIWSRARTPDELCEAAGCAASSSAAPLRPR